MGIHTIHKCSFKNNFKINLAIKRVEDTAPIPHGYYATACR